jgi:hypothetical protein
MRDEADGPPFGHRDLPQWTSVSGLAGTDRGAHAGSVIDHLDTALEHWLTTALDGIAVRFVSAVGADDEHGEALAVVLLSVTERSDRRDTDVVDVRDADGRVVARQPSMRFFDVDYGIVATGDPRAGHAVLGRVVQALVDDDVIEPGLVPPPLRALDVPVELCICTDPASRELLLRRSAVPGVVVRLVVPFRPTADDRISAPAIELHLEMSPPPQPVVRPAGTFGAGRIDPVDVLAERVWTTVRRRELIALPTADEVTAPSSEANRTPTRRAARPAVRKGAG